MDPNFNDTSPYGEPNGVLTGGFIAAVIISSIVVAAVIFYAVNRILLMRKQDQSLKAAFGAAVSRHIDDGLTSSSLSPEKVSKLFRKVDIDNNGNISKAELKSSW